MKKIYFATAILILLISGTSCRSQRRTTGHTYEVVQQVPIEVEPTIVAPPPPPPVIEVSVRQQDEDNRDWERGEILQPTVVTTGIVPIFAEDYGGFGHFPPPTAATATDVAGLRRFSVVVGSFRVRANADRLQATLRSNGHSDVVIARNERGMYRVIVGSFDDRTVAVSQRDQLRRRYSARGNTAFLRRTYGVPFNDLWILDRRF